MIKNISIWIAAIALALFSAVHSIGSVAKARAPYAIQQLLPIDGFTLERLAINMVTEDIVAQNGKLPQRINLEIKQIAIRAFKSEPTTSEAVTVIGLASGSGKNQKQLMAAAASLSLRGKFNTMWQIIDSGKHNDLPNLIRNYDIALRSSDSWAGVLLPTMADALAIDAAVPPFYQTLLRKPPWAGEFWLAAISNPNALVNASKLRMMLVEKQIGPEKFRDESMLQNLVAAGLFSQAEDLYGVLNDVTKPAAQIIRNPSFDQPTVYPPFDWLLTSNGDYGADVKNGSMSLYAFGRSGGIFARQLVSLPSRSKLTVELSDDLPTSANLSIEIICAEKVTVSIAPIIVDLKSKISTGIVSKPSKFCDYYWLNLQGRLGAEQSDIDVSLDTLNLVRI